MGFSELELGLASEDFPGAYVRFASEIVCSIWEFERRHSMILWADWDW